MCFTQLLVDADWSWFRSDATFKKMGVLMAENGGRLLGLYDEMSAFLTKIKLYSSRGLTDSHELAMFLELYNANPGGTVCLSETRRSSHGTLTRQSVSYVLDQLVTFQSQLAFYNGNLLSHRQVHYSELYSQAKAVMAAKEASRTTPKASPQQAPLADSFTKTQPYPH